MVLSDLQERKTLKLMTLEYRIESEGNFLSEPVVQLFCRDAAGEKHEIEVEGFYPFFYITERDYRDNEHDIFQESMIRAIEAREGITSPDNHDNLALTETDGAPRKTLHGQNLVRIETVLPSHVKKLRKSDLFEKTWEADVFYTNRFLVESGIHDCFSIPADSTDTVDFSEIRAEDGALDISPRMLTVDIEVWSGGTFPDTQQANKPMTAVTAHDSYDDEYIAAILHPSSVAQGAGHSWAESLDWELPDTVDDAPVRVFQNEAQMMGWLNNWIIDKDPDLMTGWNSSRNEIGSGFDYPYWINRCENINEWTYRDLSPTDDCFVTNRGSPVIGGREMFDMLQAYKKTQIHEKRSYSLGYIAEDELGYGKEDVADLDEGWLHDPVEFMKYNIRDVEAVVEIEATKNVLEMYDHIRGITGATYSEIADSNIGILDVLFLRQAGSRGIALPTSQRPDVQHYWGAYVFPPVAGKHSNVVYPDLSSLYPNLFRDMNASPETIIGFEADLKESKYSKEDCHTVYVDRRDEQAKRDADEPERTALFVLKPDVKESFVRETIMDLIDLKYEYKSDEYADEAYAAAKRITNSCFTPDTEVLTPDGIKNITEVAVGDDVYSWNKETGEMQIKSVTETIEKHDYDGEIIHIENNNIDLKVTPEHRMLVNRPRHSDRWESVDAGNLNEWTHYETPNRWEMEHGSGINKVDVARFTDNSFTVTDEYITAGNKHKNFDRYVDGDAFIDLIGWFITEGSSYVSDDTEARGDSLHISQYKSINKDSYSQIENTFDKLELTHSSGKRAIEVCGSVYPNVLDDICGSGSENKKIPSFIFEEASLEQKERLLEVLMMGDGDKRKSPKRYSTKSKKLRDDVIKLLWEIGHKPKYRYDDGGKYNTGVWRIHYTRDDSGDHSKQSFRMHRDGSVETAKNGVYCIQVEDNHTLVAGRNGKFTNIFNCYGVMGDSVSYGKGFRLFDWRIAEAITLAGRDVIKHTANEFESKVQDLGYTEAKIIAGDTDSCVCSIKQADGSWELCSLSNDEIAEYLKEAEFELSDEIPQTAMAETLAISMKAAEHVDGTYDEFMTERYNMEENNMAVEIESYAEAALFMNKKKRYSQWVRWDEGDFEDEIEVKGFELVRSDSAEITGRVQRHVIELILKEDNPKEAVAEYLQDEWESVIDGDVPLEELGKPSAVNSELWTYGYSEQDDGSYNYYTPQPHIRGARYANEFIEGEDIESGKPLMFYCDGVTESSDLPETYCYDNQLQADAEQPKMLEGDNVVDAVAVEDVRNMPHGVIIDWEKMAEKTLRDPIEPIIEVMGWSWKDLTQEGIQTGLSNFM